MTALPTDAFTVQILVSNYEACYAGCTTHKIEILAAMERQDIERLAAGIDRILKGLPQIEVPEPLPGINGVDGGGS